MDSKCNPFRSGPFRSVSGGGGQRRRENLTERDINNIYYNNNSTVPLEEGVRGRGERLRETVRRFVSAVRAGEQTGEGICPFYDDSHPAVAICIALTRDYGSFRRWRQFERLKRSRPHLVRTFSLICKYGKNRLASIAELQAETKDWDAAERLYRSHREKILNFFRVQ